MEIRRTGVQLMLLEIDSRLGCVAVLGTRINALCCENGMNEMASYQVQTAVTDALNNAIIHAYDKQSGHKVTLNWTLRDQTICIEVSDKGKTLSKVPPWLVDNAAMDGPGGLRQ